MEYDSETVVPRIKMPSGWSWVVNTINEIMAKGVMTTVKAHMTNDSFLFT